ncbi:MAG: Gfo/Idh/MocA family protein, partial [Promethearchaeota archaeon]
MITGYGGQGNSWRRSIEKHPDWELIGIIDSNTELLESIPYETLGLDDDAGYTSIEEAVRFGEKPDCVVIATPINTHHSLVRETMDLGINVICEKNMAGNIHQGKQMVQKALEHPELCTAMGTQYRYGISVWTAHQFYRSPEKEEMIGKVGMIKWEDYGYRGEKRWGWRRFLPDIYLEDMSVHWLDSMRYITGMEFVYAQGSTFMPRYSDWHGSSTVVATLALAEPQFYNDRHNWIWVDFAGDWQKRGPVFSVKEFYGEKGQFKIHDSWGCEVKRYIDPNDTRKYEEDGYLPQQDVENLGTNYTGQLIILEQMKRGIDSGGEKQPGTNFVEGFKSFAVSMAIKESSELGISVNPMKYWKTWFDELKIKDSVIRK